MATHFSSSFRRLSVALLGTGFAVALFPPRSSAGTELKKDKTGPDSSLVWRRKWEDTVKQMQTDICNAIEKVDGKEKFRLDEWKRPEGGGGWTKVLSEGNGKF